MLEITLDNGIKTNWTEDETFDVLDNLASADKKHQWLHSDLSTSDISFLQRVLWKILSIAPSFRSWIFDTDLMLAKSILIQLKPQIHKADLKKVFNRAVLKFAEIAPRYISSLKQFDESDIPLELSEAFKISRDANLEDMLAINGVSQKITQYLQQEDLFQLKLSCKNIHVLIVNGITRITFKTLPAEDDFKSLSKYPSLVEIDFSRVGHLIDDVYLKGIFKHLFGMRNLRSLNLTASIIKDINTFRLIASLEKLKVLVLSGCYNLSDDGLACLSNLINIEFLDLSNCFGITNRGLKFLSNLTQLSSLNLSGCYRISHKGVLEISKLTSLRSLSLLGCEKITDSSLLLLQNLSELCDLNLSHCIKITDQSLNCLEFLTDLKTLRLAGCYRLTNLSLKSIGKLIHLRILCLDDCLNIDSEGIQYLVNLQQLKELYLCACYDIDDNALKWLAKLESLEVIDLWGVEVSQEGIAYLDSLKKLKNLYLSEGFPIDVEFIHNRFFHGKLKNKPFKNLQNVKIEFYDRGFNTQVFGMFEED
jgi:hypothetical protein